jgi:hypothetical protein
VRGSTSGTIGTSIGLGVILLAGIALGRVGPRRLWAGWSGAVLIGTAQFVAGGGSAHPRYLLPLVPVAAILAADGFGRLHRWVLPGAVATFLLADLLLLEESWRVAGAYG